MEFRVIRHSDAGTSKKYKYVARVKTDNEKRPWRYFYTDEEYKAYLDGKDPEANKDTGFSIKRLFENGKKRVDSLFDNAKTKTTEQIKSATDVAVKKTEDVLTESPKVLNKIVDKAKEVISNIYDDKDNIYDVNKHNYDEKIEKVKASEEWKAIVARKDREYVKKNKDGTTEYLIDDYLAKKKNPILDVVDDIASGRKITVNKVEKDAVVAGLKEHAFSTITLGAMAVGVASKLLRFPLGV